MGTTKTSSRATATSSCRRVRRPDPEPRSTRFAVELSGEWEEQPIKGGGGYWYWGTALLRSLGSQSDAFLSALCTLYGVDRQTKSMRAETAFSAVGLADDPRRLSQQPVHMKLFFEHDDEARYAEVYLNIILEEDRLEFHEKDPDYRGALVQALRGEAG